MFYRVRGGVGSHEGGGSLEGVRLRVVHNGVKELGGAAETCIRMLSKVGSDLHCIVMSLGDLDLVW